MRLLTNLGASNHSLEIRRLAKIAERAWFFVAYLRKTGLAAVGPALNAAIARRIPVEFFCDINRCISEPEALHAIHGVLKRSRVGKLYLVNSSTNSFHAKLYCFFQGAYVHLIIGSANITGGGLETNSEVSLTFTVPSKHRVQRDIEHFRDTLLKSISTEEADVWNLSQYATRFGITDVRRRQAQKDALKEIAQREFLRVRDILAELRIYESDPEGYDDFSKRTANYSEARKLINRLCDKPVSSRTVFLGLYERLVGATGRPGLWHSGGLYRSKNAVALKFRDVIHLFRELRANIAKRPNEVFSIGLKLANPVKGLGVNVVTEVMNTLAPKRFPVLNRNPLTTLEYFGHPNFHGPSSFSPADYATFNEVEQFVASKCKFKAVAQVDHFLNYVYWRKAKSWKQGREKHTQ